MRTGPDVFGGFLDDDVKGLDIDVTTQDRVVTLTGTVDSELERRQAVAIA